MIGQAHILGAWGNRRGYPHSGQVCNTQKQHPQVIVVWEEKHRWSLPYSYYPQASKFPCCRGQETGLQGLQISLYSYFEIGKKKSRPYSFWQPCSGRLILSGFWSPVRNYSKGCIHSHELMPLFGECCYLQTEAQCFIVTGLKYFSFTETVFMCRILTHQYKSVCKVPLQISHPEINRLLSSSKVFFQAWL